MADNDPVLWSGQAMNFLQGYATTAFTQAQLLIGALSAKTNIEGTKYRPVVDPVGGIDLDAPTDEYMNSYEPNYVAVPALPSFPSMSDHVFPSRPSYTLPNCPSLTNISIPDFIEGNIAGITGSIPVVDFSPPNVAVISTDPVDLDSLLTTAKTKLVSNIVNGGTMLNPIVEADIWNRSLERDQQVLSDAVDELTSQWAAFGFSLPDGLLAGSIIAVNNEYNNKRMETSREIAITQAKLEQEGMFKSLDIATNLGKVIMDSLLENGKRILECAKYNADIAIEIYKQRVLNYNTLLETYKTEVETYKARVEAEVSRVEAYKARIQGLQAVVSLDDARVKAYVAQIQGAQAIVETYNSEVKATAAMYDAERIKVEGYKAAIEAYVGVIEGNTKQYAAVVEGFKGSVAAYSARVDAQAKVYDANIKAEVARVDAEIKDAEIDIRAEIEENNMNVEKAKAAAQTASSLAASALSAINASVSDSHSASWQWSYNHQYLE